MMGEDSNPNLKPEDGAAESLKKDVFTQANESGPIAPEWTMQLISHDDDIVEFDGFNLNYNEAKGVLLTFKMPILVTGTRC